MSVTTTADQKLSEAFDHVQKALENVNDVVVVRQCWGHDEYNYKAKEQLREAHALLLQVRDLLDMFS